MMYTFTGFFFTVRKFRKFFSVNIISPDFQLHTFAHLKFLRSAIYHTPSKFFPVRPAFCCRIGLGVAKDLGKNGAKVVISSRKEENVIRATESLQKEGLDVKGMVCHVGKSEDRENLVNFVCIVFVWYIKMHFIQFILQFNRMYTMTTSQTKSKKLMPRTLLQWCSTGLITRGDHV